VDEGKNGFGFVDSEKLYQLFSKCGLNWQQLTDFQTFFSYFQDFQVVEHIPDSFKMITFQK
jgi:hypothetical protein